MKLNRNYRFSGRILSLVTGLLVLLSGSALKALPSKQDSVIIPSNTDSLPIAAAEQKSEPIICKTGVYIKTVRIHQADELFEVLFYWWIRVDSVDVNGDYSHVSNIEFINAEAETEVDYDTLDPVTQTYLVVGRCKASIPYKADFRRFPYDIQSLVIAIENKVDNVDNIIFVPDNLTLPINSIEHSNIEILNGNQFSIKELTARQANYVYETNFGDPAIEGFDQYSRMEFVISVDRDPMGLMQKIALPLLVVLILSYLVFFIPDYEIGTASALTVTALLAAIAFQWTLNDALPKVSYLTMVDKIFYLVYVYIFYAMAQTVFSFNLNKQGEQLMDTDPIKAKAIQNLSDRIEWHSRYLFPLTFVLFMYYIVR
jgi:hypothetical protein